MSRIGRAEAARRDVDLVARDRRLTAIVAAFGRSSLERSSSARSRRARAPRRRRRQGGTASCADPIRCTAPACRPAAGVLTAVHVGLLALHMLRHQLHLGSLRGPPQATARDRRVRRRRHRDERARARALRDDRGRRRAGRRWRAARPLVLARRRRLAAQARIQSFTGITQDMVDARAAARGRPARAGAAAARPRARRPQRALRPHRAARRLRPRRARLARPAVLCTVALARRMAPLQRRRGLAALADALGHRGRPSPTARCPTRRHVRACSARCSAGSARTPRRSATRSRCSRRRAAAAPRGGPPGGARRGGRRPSGRTFSALPQGPGVYVFRDADGRPLYVGKSVCLRTRARAHFTTPAAWTGHAEHVDCQATQSDLGALLLEDRLIKALRPPGNNTRQAQPRRLRLPALPARHPVPDPRGRARAGGRARGHRRRRSAAAPPRPSSSSSSTRCSGCATAAGGCPRAERPRAYGQIGRCLSPCLGRPRPEPLPRAARRRAAALRRPPDGGGALLAHLDAQRRDAVAQRDFERGRVAARAGASGSRPRPPARRLLRATHAGVRLVVAPHPSKPGRFDAFWIAGGRVVDWASCPTARASSRRAGRRAARRPAPGARPLASARRGRRPARRLVDGEPRPAGARARRRGAGRRRLARWVAAYGRRRDPRPRPRPARAPPGTGGGAALAHGAAGGWRSWRSRRRTRGAAASSFACGLQQLPSASPRTSRPRRRRTRPSRSTTRRARRPARRGGSTSTGTTRSRRRSAASRATVGQPAASSWLRHRDGSSTTSALRRRRRPRPSRPAPPRGARWRARSGRPAATSRRCRASRRSRSPSRSGVPGATGADRRRPRRWRFGLPRKCSRATVSWPT